MVASYNGWTASKNAAAIDIDPEFTAAGRKFPGGVKRGPVSVVLRYVVEQFDKRVEEVDRYAPGDEWGWFFKPSANSPKLISCHSSGTAVDINATAHPNGTPPEKTFTAEQITEIRKIVAECEGVVRWLGDARHPDPMHFEISGDEQAVARVAGRLLSGEKPTPTPAPTPPEDDDMPAPQLVFDPRPGHGGQVWLVGADRVWRTPVTVGQEALDNLTATYGAIQTYPPGDAGIELFSVYRDASAV